jgi:hypothetical protein
MGKCNSEYTCTEDIYTFEPIENDNCVAIENDVCTSCENIISTRNRNAHFFNENPLKAIFDKNSSPEENDKFWDILNKNCGINRPESSQQTLPEFYIAEPDYEEVTISFNIIKQRIQHIRDIIADNNASKFIDAIFRVVNSPQNIDFSSKSNPKGFLGNKIRDILRSESCSSQIIHEPTELPLLISLFLERLSIASEDKFISVINFLDKSHQLCLEGIIEACNEILENKRGGMKRTKNNKLKSKNNTKYKNKRNKRKRTRVSLNFNT